MESVDCGDSTALPNKKRCLERDITKVIPKRLEKLSLQCEWGNCSDLYFDMMEFVKHCGTHLEDYLFGKVDKDFKCDWCDCGASIDNYPEFVRHVYFHAYHTKVKCIGANIMARHGFDTCGNDSGRNMIPELPDSLTCGIVHCGVAYDNPEVFYQHVSQHADNIPGGNSLKTPVPCEWEQCDSTFRSKHKLKDHLRGHTQEKPTACPSCGLLFSSTTRLVDHLKRFKSPSSMTFQCSHCSKLFGSKRILKDHMRQHVNYYKCPYCDMTFPAPATVRKHVRYRHCEEKPFSCSYCEVRFKSQYDLGRHLATHSEGNPYKCEETGCKFSCRNAQTLTSHFRKVHQGESAAKYACHICSKVFTRGQILTEHLKKKHNYHWPPGHSRFRYHQQSDGYFRLQTVRYESVELQQMLINTDAEQAMLNKAAETNSTSAAQADVPPVTGESIAQNVPIVTVSADNLQASLYNHPQETAPRNAMSPDSSPAAQTTVRSTLCNMQQAVTTSEATIEPLNTEPVGQPSQIMSNLMPSLASTSVQHQLPQYTTLSNAVTLATDEMHEGCLDSETEAAYTLLNMPHLQL